MSSVSVQTFRSQPTRGRPREFDIDEALDRAIPLFCKRGFHGASLKDLAAGMKLSEGSIYKAFGVNEMYFLRHWSAKMLYMEPRFAVLSAR